MIRKGRDRLAPFLCIPWHFGTVLREEKPDAGQWGWFSLLDNLARCTEIKLRQMNKSDQNACEAVLAARCRNYTERTFERILLNHLPARELERTSFPEKFSLLTPRVTALLPSVLVVEKSNIG